MNITVADTFANGFITAWPSARPARRVNVNRAGADPFEPLDRQDRCQRQDQPVQFAGVTNLIVDVMGYYGSCGSTSGGGRFAAVTPSRILDARTGVGAGARGRSARTARSTSGCSTSAAYRPRA